MINVLEAEDSVDKIKNNLDIEFEKIDETHYMDELSPELPHLNKGVSLMHQPAVSSKLRNQVQLLNRTRTLNQEAPASIPKPVTTDGAKTESRTERD